MANQSDCYGTMFPSVEVMTHNRGVSGEVFGYRVDYEGAVLKKREAIVKAAAWDKCRQCSELESCYRLSTGRLLMELAVGTMPQTCY